MNRLTAVHTRRAIVSVLGGLALSTALPNAGVAQRRGAARSSDVDENAKVEMEAILGTWKLNLAKSKYTPGPAPKGGTLTYSASFGKVKRVAEATDAEGKTTKSEWLHLYDGSIFPQPGTPDYDAGAYKLVNATTVSFTRLKAGRQVQTGGLEISGDGKTLTITTKGVNVKGQQINNVAVYDKQ
jgi:hypothetical protein